MPLKGITYCFLLISFSCFSQNSEIQKAKELRDNEEYSKALYHLNKQHSNPRINKAELELQIGLTLWYMDSLSRAKEHFQKVLGYETGTLRAADANHNIGLILHNESSNRKAISYVTESIEIYERAAQKQKLANALFNLGSIYSDHAEFDKAISPLLRASQLYENSKSLADAYMNLGYVHKQQRSFAKSKHYYLKAFKLADQKQKSQLLNSLGNLMKLTEELDSALGYYNESLQLKKSLNLDQTKVLNNIATVDYMKGDLFKALSKYKELIELKRHLKDSLSSAYTYNEISKVYHQIGQTKKAHIYLDSAFAFNTSDDLQVLMRSFEIRYLIYKSEKNHSAALKAYELYLESYKLLYDTNQSQTVQRFQEQFDAKNRTKKIGSLKKEQAILRNQNSLQAEDITNRNRLLILLALALILTITTFLVIFQRIKMRELNRRLQLQDKFKEEMGRDLHDMLGAQFTGIRLMAQSISRHPDPDFIAKEIARDIGNVSIQIRHLAHRLSPLGNRLEKTNFTTILENYFSEFEQSFEIQLTLKSEIPFALNSISLADQTNLYGILLEALNNVQKHAQASLITINFQLNKNHLICSITDNGKGFSHQKTSGIGVQNMKERTKALRGKLSIEPTGTGTTINLSFNLQTND